MILRVLVVDDSAFARKVVREVLAVDGIEVVGTARDGLDALEKIELLAPVVVWLDLMMPHLDGLGLLLALQGRPNPPRVVVVSTASDDSDTVVAALQAGAVLSVHKPTALATDRLYEMGRDLVEAVRRAGAARVPPVATPAAPAPVPAGAGGVRLVVVGASTGGPQALTGLIEALPGDFPVPICIVLHMPVGYTEAFARRMNEASALEVVEAAEGTALRPGRVVIARAGLHLTVEGDAVRLDALPLELPHRPAVDVLFASAARWGAPSVLGVVLTGMGNDGLEGSRAIVAGGGRVITQSARTCVVYGMPRSVAEAGLSEAEVDLPAMPEAILRRL